MSCPRLSCGPQTTNQTPLLHCLTLEINLLHEACPVIGKTWGSLPSEHPSPLPPTYRESENEVIWSWEREADVLDFQLVATSLHSMRLLDSKVRDWVQRFPVHQTSSAKSRKIPGKPRWVSHLIPRKINTKLHRPRVQKTFAVRAVGNLLLSTQCRTQGLPGENFTRCKLSSPKEAESRLTKHFSGASVKRLALVLTCLCGLIVLFLRLRQVCLGMDWVITQLRLPSEAGSAGSTRQTCYSSFRTAVMRDCHGVKDRTPSPNLSF